MDIRLSVFPGHWVSTASSTATSCHTCYFESVAVLLCCGDKPLAASSESERKQPNKKGNHGPDKWYNRRPTMERPEYWGQGHN
ncbi:hypothetical protein M440DRAFT_208750 [Trichoderma longibrachiatum ATCC 18648]|uniref:Uncharacterized protein n=1 Tax=Trichoderma longibrachiatum ATCC 18648 TaxID=983965 RepID=A0A2T4BR10_TRILO|nr:hypothetical protein M440DRAFT_208750 [Trichoderma longibrachiatum ATCC 18648]